jgi:hypothetical protein
MLHSLPARSNTGSRKRGVQITEQPRATRSETKKQKFRRIFPRRIGIVLQALDNAKKCADTEFYEFEAVEWKRGVRELLARVEDLVEAFETGGKSWHRSVLHEPDLAALRRNLAEDPDEDLSDIL